MKSHEWPMTVDDMHARATRAMLLLERVGNARALAAVTGPLGEWDRLSKHARRLSSYAWEMLSRARARLYASRWEPKDACAPRGDCRVCRGTGRMAYTDGNGDVDVDACDCMFQDSTCADCTGETGEGAEKIGGQWFCRDCAARVHDELMRYDMETGL